MFANFEHPYLAAIVFFTGCWLVWRLLRAGYDLLWWRQRRKWELSRAESKAFWEEHDKSAPAPEPAPKPREPEPLMTPDGCYRVLMMRGPDGLILMGPNGEAIPAGAKYVVIGTGYID
jgi:hypothetical protein